MHASGSTLRRVQRLQGAPFAGCILGVDPGLHTTGYGVIEVAGAANGSQSARPLVRCATTSALRLLEGGVLKAKASDPLPLRLQTLHDALADVLREYNPDVVVVEELFSTYAHPRSALLLAQARGVLVLAAQQSGAAVHSFTPNEVKQVVAGNGHATKSAMQQAVRSRLKLASAPHPPDVADALGLALCYAARQDLGEMLD
jgi:crossover junction endodeoxyribonuclease RuvC